MAKGKKRQAFYQCSVRKECLIRAISIDVNNNDLPYIICASRSWTNLSLATLHATTEWEAHAENIHIIVSLYSMFPPCTGMLSKRGTKPIPPHLIGHPTTTDIIIATIKGIVHVPPHHPPDMQLSTLLSWITAMPDLSASHWSSHVRALVCTTCMVRWFEAFSCINVKCSCCFMDVPLLPDVSTETSTSSHHGTPAYCPLGKADG